MNATSNSRFPQHRAHDKLHYYCYYYHYYYDNDFSILLTFTMPTISNTEAAMQQIIITYMKNLSSADQNNTANINSQNSAVKEIISLNL